MKDPRGILLHVPVLCRRRRFLSRLLLFCQRRMCIQCGLAQHTQPQSPSFPAAACSSGLLKESQPLGFPFHFVNKSGIVLSAYHIILPFYFSLKQNHTGLWQVHKEAPSLYIYVPQEYLLYRSTAEPKHSKRNRKLSKRSFLSIQSSEWYLFLCHHNSNAFHILLRNRCWWRLWSWVRCGIRIRVFGTIIFVPGEALHKKTKEIVWKSFLSVLGVLN